MINLTDEQLVGLALQNNEEALENLITRYFKRIYNFVLRYIGNQSDAEDVTQEIFLKVWKNIRRFKKGRLFKIWLFAIAKNAAFDFLRKKKIITFSELSQGQETEESAAEQIVDPQPLPSEIFEKKEISSLINRALNNLSIKERTVILLHYQESLTFQEISEIVKEPLNTVKSRYRRGLINLRQNLSQNS